MGSSSSSNNANGHCEPMRERKPHEVPRMFKGVECPYPKASTFYGSYGAVNYSLTGPANRELVVCFHGLNSSRTMFLNLASVLEHEFQVLCFDLYGHGLSNAPRVSLWPCRRRCCSRRRLPCTKPRGRYDLDFFVDQTEELLRGLGLGERRANLVGFSLGGAVAVAYAHRHPDRVGRVALMSPAGFLPKVPKEYYLLRATWCCLIPLAPVFICKCLYRRETFAKNYKGEDPVAVDSLWKRFVWNLFVKRGVISASLATMLRIPWFGLRPLYEEVGKNSRPVLLVWGENDALNPPMNTAPVVLNCFSNAKLQVISSAGHIVIADQPRAAIEAVLRFLRLAEDARMDAESCAVPAQLLPPAPEKELNHVQLVVPDGDDPVMDLDGDLGKAEPTPEVVGRSGNGEADAERPVPSGTDTLRAL
eukprot:TRINITY_DN37227_c0_g1_i1.p1 TRINITY_DN37227_c0_g1~~TRINITY_DN37227_c0_g1_i1.p1  ORF type:complete len:419 (-),score=48.37 TRINITY_DN37227_c0_g1_i1:148-1404(-)